jgi:hypothetical protein
MSKEDSAGRRSRMGGVRRRCGFRRSGSSRASPAPAASASRRAQGSFRPTSARAGLRCGTRGQELDTGKAPHVLRRATTQSATDLFVVARQVACPRRCGRPSARRPKSFLHAFAGLIIGCPSSWLGTSEQRVSLACSSSSSAWQCPRPSPRGPRVDGHSRTYSDW